LYIGQEFSIEVQIGKDEQAIVIPPKRLNSNDAVLLDTEVSEMQDLYKYFLSIAVFDTGKVDIPSITFYRTKENKVDSLSTASFSVWVSSSLSPADSLITDIKAAQKVFLKVYDYLIILLFIAIIIIIYIAIKAIIRKKRAKPELQIIDTRPAWEKAYEMLLALKDRQLLELNEWIDYHYYLSLVLRYFLMYHYGMKAVEMTTQEITDEMEVDLPARIDILKLLRFCDQIKFAKGIPNINESKAYEQWLEDYLLSFQIEDVGEQS
jgi:hypothetical protein